jgi:DNA (cytosine-5)-methyltransferase 1
VTEITFGSLFAGIGGIDLGFERAGMACKWQVEIDQYAQRVLAKHWPDVRRHDDVRTWPQPDTERVDVIAGGFPCQDISNAGKRKGLAGERSGLFFEVVRIISEMGPRIFVLENVAAIAFRGADRVVGELSEIGYSVGWNIVPAASMGAPHIRERMFFVGVDSNTQSNIVGSFASVWSKSSDYQPNAYRSGSCEGTWWEREPAVGRVADGIPARVDRLRGLGNAVVPQVAEFVGRMVVEALNREPAKPPG